MRHTAQRQVNVHKVPSDAVVTLDGNPIGDTTPPLEDGSAHRISVSRLGYQTQNPAMKVNGPDWNFTLVPSPLHISVSVSETSGTVWLDNQQVNQLDNGTWSAAYPSNSSDEHHVLLVKDKKGTQLFKLGYTMAAGKQAIVDPFRTKDLLVASSLGKEATIYSGNSSSTLVSPDGQKKPIPRGWPSSQHRGYVRQFPDCYRQQGGAPDSRGWGACLEHLAQCRTQFGSSHGLGHPQKRPSLH